MGANTNYKDSVFSFLFSDPDTLRELYGAITGVELPPDVPVTINTLEGVLYKNLLNDISFEIGRKLVIILEHQSTIWILRDFFEEHGTEVVNMLMAEWKLEDALVVEREEGREEGQEKGWKERGERDREETIRNLLDFGMKAEQISRALKLPLDTVQRYFP